VSAGPLSLTTLAEGDAVVLCVALRPELQCFCLEHEWRVSVSGPVEQEWRWRARVGEEGYRGLSLKWKPPFPGTYRVSVELVTHGIRAEGSFTYPLAQGG